MASDEKKREIEGLRERLNDIDNGIVKSFEERMSIVEEIGNYKKTNNIAIQDASREEEVVNNAISIAGDNIRAEVILLMRSIMSLSREYQRRKSFSSSTPDFLPSPVPGKVNDTRVCYQGVPGAWSELAARKMFPEAEISNVDYFENVFRKVKEGGADYGVLPIENSKTGAIGETYDLLRRFGCYIVGRTWIDIKHCLLAKPGTTIKDIREVHSHPQGFQQCRHYLEDKPWDQIASRNTAVAAEVVAMADGLRVAAIGSEQAAENAGLTVLARNIMDSDTNRTSFVVISADPEYDENSDLISFSFTAAHRAGSLCEALLPFMAAGVNLTRIESRPSSSASSYRFFAEISGNIADPVVVETLTQVAAATDYFEVIGCYNQK